MNLRNRCVNLSSFTVYPLWLLDLFERVLGLGREMVEMGVGERDGGCGVGDESRIIISYISYMI